MLDLVYLREAVGKAQIIDLSQTLEEHIPNYPTHSKFYHNLWGSYWHGDRALTYQITMNEHNGTHVDAPAHFISDAKPGAHVTIDQVPLNSLIGRGVKMDCRQFRQGQCVSASFVKEWEDRHVAIERGDIVCFNFGWSSHWNTRPKHKAYIADWPGVGMDAARYLIEKQAAAIGVDTLSPDNPAALSGEPIHPVVLEKQILIVENLANLEQLPDAFLFLALPLKIRAGSGSPVRAVAMF